MPKKKIENKVGFYCQLPAGTVAEIRRRARLSGWPQWRVVRDAIKAGRNRRG